MVGSGGQRGVSPVIGVVLMVAIVVMLAATVGVFVLQYGEEDSQFRPQVAATAEYDDRTTVNGEYVNVTFHGGDVADTHNLSLVLSGAEVVDPAAGSAESASLVADHLESEVGSAIVASDTVTINLETVEKDSGAPISPGSEHLDLSDATVRIVWNPSDPDIEESSTIWRWEPDR